MGFLQFGVICVCVLVIAYIIIWLLGMLAPGHPGIIDNLVWVIAVIIILVALAGAVGLSDVAIPRLFH
jgi:hypothetical protein